MVTRFRLVNAHCYGLWVLEKMGMLEIVVTPSESALCKFQRFPPNPHRNDSKVPTRHLRAGGKRSNNITQQSSMGPTEQIYIQHDSMSQEYRYTEQRSKSP